MFKMLVFVISIISLLDLSVAQLVQNGQCDLNITLVQNFDVNSFLGQWFVTKRFENPVQNGDCSILEFVEESGNLTVYNRAVQNNFLDEIRGSVSLESGTAKFTIILNNSSEPLDFWILPTANSASNNLGYSCTNLNNTHRNIYIWQLSRTSTVGDMIEGNMNQTLITLLGITIDSLPSVDHSAAACHVLPDIPAGQPVVLPGQCNQNIKVVQQFNALAFNGVWHEILTYASTNEIGTCRRAQYQLSGSSVEIINSEVVSQALRVIRGNATVSSSDGSAQLAVTLEVAAGVLVSRPLWVLDTDYTSYAVSYTCENLPDNQKRVNSWILSRSRQLTASAQEAVNAVIRSEIDLNSRFYVKTNQSDDGCFYLPEFIPNQAVVFPGQCDLNIKGMGNFNVTKYLGLWHNIESYHATSQRGNCLNARYSLGSDVVNVFNTQVVNQELDSITGTAVINSTDGTAALLVSFQSVSNTPNTANYIVLDSDYDSYAIVYSCSNINSEERRVTAFKLSRTKELGNSSLMAIDTVISQIPVLDQRYFSAINHTEEGCFYYPEPQPGAPVIFPGKCEDNVNVLQNFSLEQFGGIWFEIETYPSRHQLQRHCVNHNFNTTSNTTFSIETSSVNNQFLEIFNSSGVFESTDGSARMSITLTTQNGQEIIPFWILDTDYSNYALAYGCVDMPDDYRLVYSWKLSRNNQMSEGNMTAIDNSMANVTVLENRYFENINQSNEGCFFLPEIPKGDPVIINGQCNSNISVVSNFNATAYLGNWRLIESYASQFQTGTCNKANYALGENNTVVVTNSEVVNQTLYIATGSATILSNGRLLVNFPGSNRSLEYLILDTDYSSYSFVYSCENIDTSRRRVWSWKLSRTRDLTSIAMENINRIINNIDVLNNRYFEDLDQSDDGCFYYPNPDPTKPVIFPGQCDPNIGVVTNFNASGYMDLWHDIASYPTQFQNGTCNNAFYTLQNEAVDVFNTQVINQTLDTINGIARLASTGGDAKLIVSFPTPSGGLTASPYWVLDTDYTSYALVYSCLNLDDERRQVWAWTLSRTKQLTDNATAAIDRVASNIAVLDSRYYVKRDQSAEGCFYYPEPKPGVVVEFPGQCANIQAVQNFNMSLFQGLWHEIEAYPKEQQTGQCINHNYALTSGNSSNIISTYVITKELGVTNSTVTFASAEDSSGNLTITLIFGGEVIKIPFVVLDTDYTSYALAYSCISLPNDFQRVFSWKLSRNKWLTPENVVAINNATANINVLDSRYYENIDQTDNACFYLPTPVPGVPVEFVGQCDNNITVVQNFNASDYLGRWLLIESYPAPQQEGSCNDATYSLNSNGDAVDVYNTKVLNQELVTINGTAVLATNDGSAKLLVTFPGTSNPAPYWVLDTDYKSFSLVYSCQNLQNNRRRVTSWKLSRTSELTPNATARINQVISQVNILDDRYFESVNRSDSGCFYFPTPGSNAPIFRGVCDENIPVVTNYNASAYSGRWYDIQSYPTRYQTGTCNTVLGQPDVETLIYKTQVLNEGLDQMWGISRNQSSSNIAKFNVRFSDSSTEYPYWILSTDYVSYSLVYSCVNLPDRRFQVNSWKLSRTKQLTPNATAAIDGIVNSVPVLDNKYYNNRNHTDQGCFYYPKQVSGAAVIFPGQCDTTIQAQPNFNMSAFSGIWHEIEAYPENRQVRQCINHNYNLVTNNILNLLTSSVFNQYKNVTNSSATFTSNQDSSGKLTISHPNGNTVPFWILSTDYTNYALAYSCVNINETFREVSSWKLSRNQQLTSADNIAINNVTANINVLDSRYYENIDQTDNSCFYLPTPVPGVPVEFVGQCDNNITVVKNFNASDYLGRWLLIESYPAPQQEGSCSDATYSLNSNGDAVDVYNTKVLNQELVTINGTAVLATNDGSAKLLVTFPGTSNPAPYWVLDTDYKSFSLVYSCQNLQNNRRRVTSWKLSRTSELTPNATARINQVISQVNILDDRYFESVNRSDSGCFYFPTPGSNAPIFRGVCDENIPVVTNYNASAYSGRWYDIQSYPTRYQTGTCNTVLGQPDVETLIYKTQVLNEGLDQMWGISRNQSSSNIAKFNVRFSDSSTEYPYWILSTDYVSYSLVYSCVNLPDRRFQVNSWKLSRTKQLTPNATAAIDGIVNSVPVLDNKYYNNRNHTDQGCFYYPKQVSGAAVIFPGQCDTTIQAQPNFNMSAFSGIWHEIEAYPENRQVRQCINHNYNLVTNNILNLLTSSVFNQYKNVTNSSATFTSNQDSSGKLTISHPNGNTVPFWILSTDYTNYALAYSCVNINETFREVSSWKLSRNQQLTSADNIAINNVTANINVLDSRYYENIDQTDNSCFYLPTPVPGVPVEFVGQCDNNITVVKNFNASDYLGRWLLIESYPAPQQEGSCSDATYSLNSNGDAVDVYNTKVLNQELVTINGTAVLATNDGSAKLLVTFPGTSNPAPYWVLDTDYKSFSLVYSCQNLQNNRRRVTSWKLSRTSELTPNATARINQVISQVNILDDRYFESVNRSDSGCFYFPTPGSNAPIFRGVCDENIPVVTNYNASAYSGRWYDIQSYPTRYQTGTCNTVLGQPDVETLIYKTQVLNEGLDQMWGISRNQSSSNIAKFNVRFSDSSTEYPYWILSTDYVSYSLVYSCVNLPDRRFQVNSWKLSRTKQLTPNATAAIDGIVNSVPVLDNKYYNNRNHTDQGCFYYPKQVSGAAVIFPGQCDTTIQAQPNFNMSAFSGIWHEIEAYPENRQVRQCINHNYNLVTNNILNLLTSSVFNQYKNVTNSSATFTSNQDSSGKLTISHPNGNTVPFWILSTDYTNYALAYSCVNINETFREVSSWKLSRNQQLTSADNIVINNVTANINVLDSRYYENIDQTDNACFYLPTPVPGVPVEFVGQCDNNITVVKNFNASDYLGRWLLIESYPAPQQEGSCNDATYSLNSNGAAVDVYNTKVLNQELVTINGTAVLATNDGSAKLLVTFPGTSNPAPYWVLDTDYKSFSLVYSCQNLQNNRRRVTSWKLSRTSELTPNATARINQVMSQVNVLDDRYFESVNRSDSGCFYFPTPGSNPIHFRGRCDNNIAVVQNFNATAYLGTWYDIESYPVGFQFGSCPTATYETSNIGISVYNTEVVAQRLSSIRGNGVLTSVDGSAKLMVVFPISGTNATTSSPYWVLATDYNNYALVYSCVELNSEYRRVSSWKLSRTKTLTPASTTQINTAMSSVPVLDQKYYLNRGHKDEDCFFYPDNNGGPVVQSGQCDINLNIVNNFDIEQFSGPWFEISRFFSELQNGECVSNNFTVNNDTMELSKSTVYNELLTTVVGSAIVPQDKRGIITVNLTDGAGATFATTYQVLDVVYNDFALLHNCRNLNSTHKQIYSWKLSRSQAGLSALAVARINEVVDRTIELFEDYYDTTDQSVRSCFHYPVFDQLPSFIEFIGPCNTTIRAKSNFDVTAYLGKWHEIESYPQAFQNGECARAQYSAGNNVVNVLNTQVVNRTLDAQIATAVVASNDGSGLLEVTFSFGNVINVVNYYVLETDYTSFSFVYSCQDLPNGNRRVSSWKLSRGKVLPSTAQPIIENIINNVQGLNQDYYKPTSQSDEDCFYIPQVDKNEAPLFRGQCEVTTGMQGFDVQKYLGWWHEIESYPTNSGVGTCISSNIKAVNNQYQITDTNVFNNSAQVNTSTVEISADGRIRKALTTGVVVDIWILETDYETYSLLYSCENANSDYKRVWSAKHSKSRQLTVAAQQAMAPIIARTETLEPQFYIPIDQTDEVCFHYPEQTGMQIILPGQCDPNIPVEQNFEPAKYSGTWYQIEKYPQRFENGTCIGARYTLDENTGVVKVLNWQVWNDTLDTVVGNATVSSTDGSAKLIVNLPVRGSNDAEPVMVSMELYILKTDYITYSLAYSCVNINPFQRGVGVWKLSRTRTLPVDSNSQINIYMNTRPELHQPYFETVEQDNKCEEPSSSYIIKSSIIIVLICSLLHLLY